MLLKEPGKKVVNSIAGPNDFSSINGSKPFPKKGLTQAYTRIEKENMILLVIKPLFFTNLFGC